MSRLMALALRFDEQVRTGQVASYSALASLGLGHYCSDREARPLWWRSGVLSNYAVSMDKDASDDPMLFLADKIEADT